MNVVDFLINPLLYHVIIFDLNASDVIIDWHYRGSL